MFVLVLALATILLRVVLVLVLPAVLQIVVLVPPGIYGGGGDSLTGRAAALLRPRCTVLRTAGCAAPQRQGEGGTANDARYRVLSDGHDAPPSACPPQEACRAPPADN